MRAAGGAIADLRRVSLRIDGLQFASLAACGCTSHPRLSRFIPLGDGANAEGDASPEPARCPGCGQVAFPHPMHVFTDVPLSLLENELDVPLFALGAASASSVRVRTDVGATRFLRPFPEVPEVTR